MKKHIILIFCILFSIHCKSQNENEFSSLKKGVSKILFEKKLIDRRDFEKDNGFSVYGLHHESIIFDNLKKGVYGVSIGGHKPVYFLIYEKNKINFLDIFSFKELIKSMKILLQYSFKEGYCQEITIDYVSRLLRSHYNINRNLRNRIDENCEFPKTMMKSIYNYNNFKFKIAKEIERINGIRSIETFLDNPELLIVQKTDIYYGILEKDKNLDVGLYSYISTYNDDTKEEYVLLDQDHLEFLKTDSNEAFIKTIQDIMIFGEENKVCSEKIIWLIKKISDSIFNKSCFCEYITNLP